MTNFIAIDGEGYTDETGTHIYNLLASSDGSYLHDDNGLDTEECFKYFIDLKQRNPDSTFVSFYFSYDVNMILGDLPFELVDTLRRYGHCYAWIDADDNVNSHEYYGYKIEYFPRKMFRIAKGKRDMETGSRKFITETSITIWDVFGFFQCGFVKALAQFGVGSEEELQSLQSMKEQRGTFETESFDSILEYNGMECRLLVGLMNQLDTSLQTAGIELSQWNGAGAVAASLLKKYDIKSHIELPCETHYNPVLHAYFGGRIQALQIGVIPDPVYGHDLVSAYPSTIQHLPSLKDCEQVIVLGYDYDPVKYPYAVWRVSWRLPHDTVICPFPFRTEEGNVEYPSSGSGFYWTCEVDTALRHYPAGSIDIDCGYAFVPSDDYKDYNPFSFVPVLFEERKRFKREGNNAQLVIKLGLNSLYGKTAQGIGYAGNRPAFQSYVYAGLITAGTRSRMLGLALTSPSDVICFCTDGLYATRSLAEDTHDKLGGWECETYDNMFILKAGFYMSEQNGERKVSRLRGFRSNEVSWDAMLQEWNANGVLGSCKFPCRSFIGMKGSADLHNWRSWIDSTKTLSFMPSTGFPDLVRSDPPLYRMAASSYAGKLSCIYEAETYDDIFDNDA